MKYLFLFLSFSVFSQQKSFDKVTTLGDYENILKDHEINYSDKHDAAVLINYINDRLDLNIEISKNKTHEDYKRAKNEIPFLKIALKQFKNFQNPIEAFDMAARVLYSLDSEFLENDSYTKIGKLKLVEKIFKAQAKFDISDNRSPNKTISKKSLKKVALNLAKSPSQYYTFSEMEKLTPKDISELDISENHPKWFQNSANVDGKKHWEYIENWVNSKVSKKLTKKNDRDIDYNLETAHRILVFDGMKSNDSSPKFKTKDIYGMKWKLKMGEEIHTEPILNRLYVLLGGKFNDLVYAQSVTENNLSVIILNEQDSSENCEEVASLEKLKDCFLNGYYNFDVSSYVHSYGTISEENLTKTFKPKNEYESKKLKKYIGRKYLILKESSLEYKDHPIIKAGATALSNLDATTDRVQRGLALFHSWVSNGDLRDANTRSYVLEDFMGKDQYIEADHDLGASLGFMLKIGSINHYKTKDNFLMVTKRNKELVILDMILNRPKSWTKVTYADVLWMLNKIEKLNLQDLKWAISYSALPTFMEDIIYNKMVSRINSVFEVFRMNRFPENKKLTYSLPVNSEIASSFNIAQEEFLDFSTNNPKYNDSEDQLSLKNKISECNESFWINLLERTNHPSGLSRKLMRFKDNRSLADCALDLTTVTK